MNDQTTFLLNSKLLRVTLYLSLVIGHLIFGVLYPEAISIAATGFAFFAALVLFNLRSIHDQHTIKIEDPAHVDK